MIGALGALDFKSMSRITDFPQGKAASLGASGATGSFASVLSDLATKSIGTLNTAEQMSIQGLKGDADTRQVVDAVMSAEQTLQAAVAIRDKIVSAYMEISRMGI